MIIRIIRFVFVFAIVMALSDIVPDAIFAIFPNLSLTYDLLDEHTQNIIVLTFTIGTFLILVLGKYFSLVTSCAYSSFIFFWLTDLFLYSVDKQTPYKTECICGFVAILLGIAAGCFHNYLFGCFYDMDERFIGTASTLMASPIVFLTAFGFIFAPRFKGQSFDYRTLNTSAVMTSWAQTIGITVLVCGVLLFATVIMPAKRRAKRF